MLSRKGKDMQLSGQGKLPQEFATGTPADDDYILFGKSQIKKISIADLKEVLGINGIISSLTLINSVDDTTNGSSFAKNFVATGTQEQRSSSFFNKPEADSDWKNVPGAMRGVRWLGYRQVYRLDSNRILVTVLELFPTHGRTWSSFYNNGSWTSWTSSGTPS